jgi:hypothetical protein
MRSLRLVLLMVLVSCGGSQPQHSWNQPDSNGCVTENHMFSPPTTECAAHDRDKDDDDDDKDDDDDEKPAPKTTTIGKGGWWCFANAEFGACSRRPGVCEADRTGANRNAPPDQQFQPCGFRPTAALCSPIACFTTPNACAHYERQVGRDGTACEARD